VKTFKKTLLLLVSIIILTACNLPAAARPDPTLDLALVGTIAAMTLQAIPSQTPPPPSLTPALPTVTKTATVTITPTYATPLLQFTGNTNCRKGPGTEYEVVTVVLAGQKAEATGVSQKGSYWLIKNPNKGDACWVAGDFANASGSMAALPTVMAPPTPTPIPPSAPVWSNYAYTCAFASGGNDLTMNLAWTDRSSNEEGYVVYRDGQAIVNLGPDSTSFVDVAFVASGASLSYRVEAFSKAGRASSSTISASCQ